MAPVESRGALAVAMAPTPGNRVPQGLANDRLGLLYALLQQFGLQRWSQYVRQHWSGQRLVIAIPWVWLFLFFVVPFLIVFKISFSEIRSTRPKFCPT